MSSTTRRPGARACKPGAESLEGRTLLSKVLSGTDVDGDRWVLRLNGPGDVRVVNQPTEDGDFVPLGEPALIDSITFAGTDPRGSTLVGTVTRSEGGDGKVYFENMEQFGGNAIGVTGTVGIHVIDMPDFWLGRTSTAATTTGTPAAEINIRDGVNNLRFGGTDTTFTPEGGTPLNQNGRNDLVLVRLGLPYSAGTSIVIDRSITSGQAAQGTTAATQDGVQYSVFGRINMFQANAIEGNANLPSGQFVNQGGTLVISASATEPNAVEAGELTGQVIGQIGYVRVGGNATNFSVQTNDRISNFYIGGETNNVFVLAPQSLRHALFGRGMDTVNILAESVFVLQANRGAIGSQVITDRAAGQFLFGGDVINSQILSGYKQDLGTVFTQQFNANAGTVPPVQDGGTLQTVMIAGDVINSIFAASVGPLDDQFGTSEDLLLPHGRVNAKVEGQIINDAAVPDNPTQAFFAKNVHVTFGPVVPPNVAEPPFPHPGGPPMGSRLSPNLLPSNPNAPRRQARLSLHDRRAIINNGGRLD